MQDNTTNKRNLLSSSRHHHLCLQLCILSLLACLTTQEAWAQRSRSSSQLQVVIGTAAQGSTLSEVLPTEPLLVAIDSPYQAFGDNGTLIHVAAWTANGTPAEQARVYLGSNLIGEADQHGTLVFRLSSALNRSGSDRVTVRWENGGSLYGGDVSFNTYQRTSSFASHQVFVYTDRGIYNPGDTIHTRSLLWHLAADYTAADDSELELLLSDPSGRIVAGGSVTTNDFGVAALDLPISNLAEEGIYTLTASFEGSTANARIRIEHFTPPVIRIEHTLGRFLTRDQRELAFDVTLGTFTEAEFVSGSISIEARLDSLTLYSQQREVSSPGPHSFLLTSQDLNTIRRSLTENAMLEIRISATDQYGRRDRLTREMRYLRNPYVVVIEKDRDYYSPGDPVELIVRLSDRDNVPLRNTEVTLLPSHTDALQGISDERGTVQFSLVMPNRSFEVEVLLEDVSSPVARRSIPLHGAQPMRSHIAQAIVVEDEPVNITVTFPSRFVPAESVVHLDVVDSSGSLVQSVLIPVISRNGEYRAEGSFTSPSWGSMLLTLFCLGYQPGTGAPSNSTESTLGLLTEGQNLAVHPGRHLTVHLDGIPEQLEPGALFTGQIRVSDRNGELVSAMVGASVVDLAVISLKDPLEITPMDRFYNPRLRVMSTTGSAILTWPVVSRNWGQRRRDVALPPFSYLPGGRIHARLSDKAKDWSEFDEESGVEDYAYLGERPRESTPPPIITIRTEFPSTSLWEPFIDASSGTATISGIMPDAITTQEIALVASDRSGRVGIHRLPVRVTQPLFVQADFPDTLTIGDQVDAHLIVQNTTGQPLNAELNVVDESNGRRIFNRSVQLEGQETQALAVPLRATRAGHQSFRVTLEGANRIDSELHQIWVRPVGFPTVTQQDQVVNASAPTRFELEVPANGQHLTVGLNLTFPAVSAGFSGLNALRSRLSPQDTMSLGGHVIAEALLLQYQLANNPDLDSLAPMKNNLQRNLANLLASQRQDGGWGYWWHIASNPHTTTYCLEALIEIDRAGLAVPTNAFRNAINYLHSQRQGDYYDYSGITFWEGHSDSIWLALTAQAFATLSNVPQRARTRQWRQIIDSHAPRLISYLSQDEVDISTLAHIALGLHRASRANVIELDRSLLDAAIVRLALSRHEGYWEPSWFHAYGGTIEATEVVLRLMAELGEQEQLAFISRDAVRYLLSTRDEWGGWHNYWGTASAIRSLLILNLAPEREGASVVVRVGQREIRRIDIDSADPFLSALALRDLDLTSSLTPGTPNRISIEYDGALQPVATLTMRHWDEPTAQNSQAVQLESALSTNHTNVGGLITYTLNIRSAHGAPRTVDIDLAAPANAQFDTLSLEGLRERGLIDGFIVEHGNVRLTLQLEGHSEKQLELLMVAERAGEAVMPVAVASLRRSEQESSQGLAIALLSLPLVVE